MTEQHPITPPPELVEQWYQDGPGDQRELVEYVATEAARWGADQELEACCEVLCQKGVPAWSMLRSNRRPKPLSSKEEALQVLEALIESRRIVDPEYQALRHALEQLND